MRSRKDTTPDFLHVGSGDGMTSKAQSVSVRHESKTRPALFRVLDGFPKARALAFGSPITRMVPYPVVTALSRIERRFPQSTCHQEHKHP
jgi:hypothetical protein